MTEILKTLDGSFTLQSTLFPESYHSMRGAVGESMHTFIGAAMECRLAMEDSPRELSIFEVGFGSGLNGYLTMEAAERLDIRVKYHSIELYPITGEVAREYGSALGFDERFERLHSAPWGAVTDISPYFSIEKISADYTFYQHRSCYDVVYFDAFSPDSVPDMWSKELFGRLYGAMNSGAVLTTYCAKGTVRRAMAEVGFLVKRVEGALGKRHMTQALK